MPAQISYVFDQICIVAAPDAGATAIAYEEMRTGLNTRLQQLIAVLAPGSLLPTTRDSDLRAVPWPLPSLDLIGSVLPDLTRGPELQALIDSKADILQVIPGEPDLLNDAQWVDTPTTTHYFYQIGGKAGVAPDFPSDADSDARHLLVRDLVLLINLNTDALSTLPDPAGGADIPLSYLSAAPNWLCTIAENPCCSPASDPVDVKTTRGNGFWSFDFPGRAGAIATAGRNTPPATPNVVVAILDTSPVSTDTTGIFVGTRKTVANLASNKRYANNLLLKQVAAGVAVDDPISPPPTAFDALLNYLWSAVTAAPAKIPVNGNHGLFIAGIIHDIAPHVETHLIRAMHEGGISDIRRFTTIMKKLPTDYAGKNLVVNMSVDFTVPPGIELIKKNLPTLFTAASAAGIVTLSDLVAAVTTTAQAIGLLATLTPATQLLFLTAQAFIESLLFAIEGFSAGVKQALSILTSNTAILVVGAAGNDNNRLPPHDHYQDPSGMRPEPRWPAYHEEVLAVGATRSDGTPTRYSNLADDLVKDSVGALLPPDNAIATFGGDTKRVKVAGVDTDITDEPNAVRGIGEIVGTATCLMYWAGTSFATPVISALAADYWDMVGNSTLPASQVLTDFTGFGDTGILAPLNSNAITATQTTWKDTWW